MRESIRRRPAPSRRGILAGFALMLGFPALAAAGAETLASPFEEASVYFEQNATDGDVEVVFAVTGGDEGLSKLTVVCPDGRTVVDFAAPDASTLGIRSFSFVSPEPRDVVGLKTAYPEGVYSFAGETASGEAFRGQSTLSHELPAPTSILGPGLEATGVGIAGLEIRWAPIENVSAYIVEIEGEGGGGNLKAHVSGALSAFRVPEGFLQPGTEYELGIGTVTERGNVSFVESTFTTAE